MGSNSRNGNGSKKIEELNVSKEIHALSRNNAKLIKKSKQVGCFYCLKIYQAKEVKNYRENANKSAICIYCNIDALIPDSFGIELTEAFLKAMRNRWFNQ